MTRLTGLAPLVSDETVVLILGSFPGGQSLATFWLMIAVALAVRRLANLDMPHPLNTDAAKTRMAEVRQSLCPPLTLH